MKKIFILIAVISLFSCEKEDIVPGSNNTNTQKSDTIQIIDTAKIKSNYLGCWETVENNGLYSVCFNEDNDLKYLEIDVTVKGGELINDTLVYDVEGSLVVFWFKERNDTIQYSYYGDTEKPVLYVRK